MAEKQASQPQTTLEWAREAKLLLDNRYLPLVIEQVKGDIIAQWSVANKPEDREAFWHLQRSLEHVAGAIRSECERAIKRVGDD